MVEHTSHRFAIKGGGEPVDLPSVQLRLVTDPSSELPAARRAPEHRSPRWLGGLSIVLTLLTLSQVFFAVEAVTSLFR